MAPSSSTSSSKPMKRVISSTSSSRPMKRVIVFVLLVVLLDLGLGWVLARIYRQSFTGDRFGLLNYALTQEPQILVLGSSRAQYHIMPSVLTKELGLTAYNAGLKGQDFLYS